MTGTHKFEQNSFSSRPSGLGCRHYQCFMLFCMLVLAFSMRSILAVAIVAMTSPTGTYTDSSLLPWTSAQQGTILGAFFWGYIWLQMLFGNLSGKYGSKYFLFGAMLVCSIITILSPLIAYNCSWVVFCISRVVVGLAQGCFYPVMITHQTKWAPLPEKGRLISFIYMGTQFGSMVAVLVAGYLAASTWGWPSIFYVVGLCGLVALKLQIPWKKIATSIPVWTIVITHCCQNWGYWMIASMMPTYLSHVLNFDIKNNGLFSALPYLTQCVFIVLISWIDDFVKKRHLLSLGTMRKIFMCVALWGGAIVLVVIPLTTSTTAALALFTLAITLHGGVFSGIMVNHSDLSPNFAGFVMGITEGCASLNSILGPTVTGLIVQNTNDRGEWLVAFVISAVLFFLGTLLFVVFGSAEVQSWNEPQAEDKAHSSSIHSSFSHKDSSQTFDHTHNKYDYS